MSVIIVLIIISVTVAVFFLGIFIWAVKSGQYDDTYSPSVRMLFEDKKPDHQKDRPINLKGKPTDKTVKPSNNQKSIKK